MIFDSIDNLACYIVPEGSQILNFISQNNCSTLENGQIDIEGKDLFVKVIEYIPEPATQRKFETHSVYADVQYIVSGIELMQVVSKKYLKPLGECDKAGDFEFYKADQKITDLVVEAGQFVIFFPGEAHRPACLYQDNQNKVKKLVFKIKMK